jgi:hypothetical protein
MMVSEQADSEMSGAVAGANCDSKRVAVYCHFLSGDASRTDLANAKEVALPST